MPRIYLFSLPPVLLAVLTLVGCPGTGSNTANPPLPSPRVPSVGEDTKPFFAFAGSVKGDRDGLRNSASFNEPSGIEVDVLGRLFIAEVGGHRIRRLEPDGSVTTVAGSDQGWRDGPALEARFNAPAGIAVMRDGTLVVADTGNNRVRMIAPDGEVTTLAGDGTPGTEDGEGNDARFRGPLAVVTTTLDEILVADTGNHRIRSIDRTGRVTTIAGGEVGYIDGSAREARFNGPADLALDAQGRVYVADLRNHVIRRFDRVSEEVRTLAGTGNEGQTDGASEEARFKFPSGLAITVMEGLYVADAGNQVVRGVASNGRTRTIARIAGAGLADVAVGPDGTIYVTDSRNHLVLGYRHGTTSAGL